jgi:predicted 3-demethylubiquinone-9 3-methyltransferase (glyoxalase superfamily)
MTMAQHSGPTGPITPCLWFDTEAEQAAEYYTGLFPDSKITDISHYPEGDHPRAGTVLTVAFQLNGQPFTALNGGPEFTFSEAISFQVRCETSEQLDELWDALTAEGGEGQCGWVKDRFGVSWQLIPEGLEQVLGDPDPGRAQRAMAAMMTMTKLDLDAMRAAADAG